MAENEAVILCQGEKYDDNYHNDDDDENEADDEQRHHHITRSTLRCRAVGSVHSTFAGNVTFFYTMVYKTGIPR